MLPPGEKSAACGRKAQPTEKSAIVLQTHKHWRWKGRGRERETAAGWQQVWEVAWNSHTRPVPRTVPRECSSQVGSLFWHQPPDSTVAPTPFVHVQWRHPPPPPRPTHSFATSFYSFIKSFPFVLFISFFILFIYFVIIYKINNIYPFVASLYSFK